MTQELEKKVQRAIKLIQSASKIAIQNGCPEIEVAYSGGKDSDVILELTKMANVPYRAIYKNTTIDPSGTIKHAIEMGAEIIRPKRTFFQIMEKAGFPNRLYRHCCRTLKEYKVLDYVVLGIRASESSKRAKYKEIEVCKVFSKKEKARHYYPILDWDNVDVESFLKERNITCAPIYYDDNHVFHVERRLGCLCCPLASKGLRIKQFLKHPNMVKAYIRAGIKYLSTHDNKTTHKWHDVYEWFVYDVFYSDVPNKWEELNSGFLPPPILRNF